MMQNVEPHRRQSQLHTTLTPLTLPGLPPRRTSLQGPARSAGFRLPALFHNAKTTAGPVRVQFYRERRSTSGRGMAGHPELPTVAISPPPRRHRYRTRYRFQERTESSLMTEGVECRERCFWEPMASAERSRWAAFPEFPMLATAVPWRRELIRGREFHPAGSPQDIQVQKDNNNAPRRHEAGTMFEVWRGTKNRNGRPH